MKKHRTSRRSFLKRAAVGSAAAVAAPCVAPRHVIARAGEPGAEQPRDHGVCEKQEFIDCVRSREETLEPAEVGHRVTSMLLMGHISVRLDRKLTFDPVLETFNDEEANEYLDKPIQTPRYS